ncbi:MAG: ABC transporter permease, partial [Bacteroidota bacterium]
MGRIFWAFIKKESYHILRDTRTLIILFGMPIALVLIFGYTVTNEFKNASIGILDKANDELSRELVEHFTASGHFQLLSLPADIHAMERDFRAGKIKLGIVILKGFQGDFYGGASPTVQLIADASEPNYATTLTNYAEQMLRSFQQPDVRQPLAFQIELQNRLWYNPGLVSAYTFIPGVAALILMLISAMMTSLTIAREKELGTMDLLLISPLPPLLIILGKVTPYVVLSFINVLIVFAMGHWIFGVPILGSLGLLLALSLLYLLVSLGLGVFISTKSENQQTA